MPEPMWSTFPSPRQIAIGNFKALIIPWELLLFCPLQFLAPHQCRAGHADSSPSEMSLTVPEPDTWWLKSGMEATFPNNSKEGISNYLIILTQLRQKSMAYLPTCCHFPDGWGRKFGKLCDFKKLERNNIMIFDICEYIKLYWIIHVKWVKSVICELYPSKGVFLVCLFNF